MSRTQLKSTLVFGITFATCLLVIAPGCGKGVDVVPVPTSPDDSMAAWRAMMETPTQSVNDPELTLLANRIGQTAPHFVDEMIAGLEDPTLSGAKLVALVASLEQVVSPDLVPRLVALTATDVPSPVRRAATHLLGEVSSEEAVGVLQNLKNDEMETVRLTALLGLAQQGDQSVRQDLRDIFHREDVMVATRERIVLVTCKDPVDGDNALFEEAIQIAGFEQNTYFEVVTALGRNGTIESIDALNALKGRAGTSVAVREMCDNTIAAIEERSEPATASAS